MKVLAIMGSPRKGKSYDVLQMIRERLQKKEDVEFEELLLMDYNLGQCKGCHACFFKEGAVCPLNNEMPGILLKMLEAEAIILITPLYAQQVTGLLKNFIDQLSYLWHRPRCFGKKAMVVVTGGALFKDTLNYMADTAKHWGYHVTSKLGVPHLDALTDSYKEKTMTKLYREVDRFYECIKAGKQPVPSLGDVIWFEMWKGNSIALKDTHPADYEYWKEKGWIEGNYYYTTNISLWKKTVVKLIGIMGGNMMKKMYKGY